jgi:hypothetical protein
MRFKIDELTPGGEDVWEDRVEDYKAKLRNNEPLDAIDVMEINGRKTVVNGHHRTRATIDYCEEEGRDPEIDGEIVNRKISDVYRLKCGRIFQRYGSGIKAFKDIPYTKKTAS